MVCKCLDNALDVSDAEIHILVFDTKVCPCMSYRIGYVTVYKMCMVSIYIILSLGSNMSLYFSDA